MSISLPIALYRTESVREIDRLTIEHGIASSFELMNRAALAVLETIQQRWINTQSLAVFCGSGNNAGDGYIVATLALALGWTVQVYSVIDPEQLKGDALTAYQNYQKANGQVFTFNETIKIKTDILIDALLGSGLNRDVTGLYAQAIKFINEYRAPILAIDNPSGLNTDTGNALGCAVKATCTVTFIALKQGLFTGFAAHYCGELVYCSLNVPAEIIARVPVSAWRVLPKPLSKRHSCAHKGYYGHVLIIGGEYGFVGAVCLAGTAALRTGAGLVSVATRSEHAALLTMQRPELMCHGVNCTEDLKPLLLKASVVVIGMGLGQSEWAKSLLLSVLKSDKPLVIDADALNLLAQMPLKNNNWILTPHVGEAARLLARSTADISQDRFSAVTQLQARYGGVVVLKGAGTLIASKQYIAVSNTGNAGMASGGMGDVLAGIIGGLIAQGLNLKQATEQGVYAHGYAADIAIEQDGECGLLASDLMPYVRRWVNSKYKFYF